MINLGIGRSKVKFTRGQS